MPAGELARALTDQHRTGLGHRLQTRGKVRCLTNDRLLLRGAFADQIAHDDGAGGDANANMQLGADIRLQARDGFDQRQPCARRLFGIILMRLGIAEIGEDAVPHVSSDHALVAADNLLDAGVIGPDHPPQVLRIEAH